MKPQPNKTNQRANSRDGRTNFAQQGEFAMRNERTNSIKKLDRPVTQEEIRRALTLLKSKQPQKIAPLKQSVETPTQKYEYTYADEIDPPYLRKAFSEAPHADLSPIRVKQQGEAPNEYEDEDEELFECPEGCGRKFKEATLHKHAKVCKKVFQQRRAKFNTQEQRIINDDHANLLHEAQIKEKIEQKKQQVQAKKPENRPIQGQKKSKWKTQSEAFRAMIRVNNGGQITAQEQAALQEAQDVDRVQCDYCGRKFNHQAAIKHIPSCQQKAKITQIKNNTNNNTNNNTQNNSKKPIAKKY